MPAPDVPWPFFVVIVVIVVGGLWFYVRRTTRWDDTPPSSPEAKQAWYRLWSKRSMDQR